MEDLKRKIFFLLWPLAGHLPYNLPQWCWYQILHHHQNTAVQTFVSSVKAATTGTICKGKVGIQMLSEPHLPRLFVAYKRRKGEQDLLGIQNGLIKSFLDQNRHYSCTYTYQSANVFIYRFIHFQIHFKKNMYLFIHLIIHSCPQLFTFRVELH